MKLTTFLRWNDYHNLPKKFVERAMFEGTTIDSNYFLRREREVNFTRGYRYTRYAPWTTFAKMLNRKFGKQDALFVMPLKDWNFFRGDKVEILTGKDKGKQGNVCGIVKQRNWIFVKDLNCIFKKSGGINGFPVVCIKEEQPLLVTKDVSLVDPYDDHHETKFEFYEELSKFHDYIVCLSIKPQMKNRKPCEIEWRYTESGERVRVSTRTERIIPFSKHVEETCDYKTKKSYQPGSKDCLDAEVSSITYVPSNRRCYEELMGHYGIEETRKVGPTYVY